MPTELYYPASEEVAVRMDRSEVGQPAFPRFALGASKALFGRLVLFGAFFCAACLGPPAGPVERSHRLELPSGTGAYARAVPPVVLDGTQPVTVVLGAAWLELDLDLPGPALFVDLPGRGEADPVEVGEVSLEADLGNLDALRARLGLERLSILGWGYYGGLAARYAARYPGRVERLILVAPLPPRRDPHWGDFIARAQLSTDPAALERLEAQRASGAKARDPLAFCRASIRLFLEARTVDPVAAASRMRSEPCVEPHLDPDVGAALGAAIVGGLEDWDWRSQLALVEAPTLVVHGRQDPYPLAGSEEYAAAIPSARLEVLATCGHLPWLEQPEAFGALVAGFLGN